MCIPLHLADRPRRSPGSAELLSGPDAKAANTFEQPDLVVAHPFSQVQIHGGQATCQLPPLSLAALTFKLA